ncbi:MAG: DUF4396 domain-containing protein [Gemmatimonadaceae bacterium]
MLDPARTIDIALDVWVVLLAFSVAYVAWDAFTRNPELRVMRNGWLLVTLYTGPIGAALYVLSCKEPDPRTHERFIAPLWKQGLGSAIHCMAGDATGIIVAAVTTALLGLPMGVDSVIEYVFGFAFGLLIFQALFMRTMLGGSYLTALRRSFLPEWVSMNAVMAGMIPVMLVLMTRHMSAMDPNRLRFWGVMSLATIVGLVVAYPANVWLVVAGLKHGMGTERVLGEGGSPIDAAAQAKGERDISTAPMVTTDTNGIDGMKMPGMGRATVAQIVAVTVLTLVALGAGVLLALLYADVSMRPGAAMRMTALAGLSIS